MNQKQIQQMMQQAQKLQKQMEGAQKDLEKKEYVVSTGGGAVEVVMLGSKQLKSLNIKEEVIDPEDKDMLQDMIVSAINQACKQIDEEQQKTMGSFTQGLPF